MLRRLPRAPPAAARCGGAVPPRNLALGYVLEPRLRALWASVDLGPQEQVSRRTARLLVAIPAKTAATSSPTSTPSWSSPASRCPGRSSSRPGCGSGGIRRASGWPPGWSTGWARRSAPSSAGWPPPRRRRPGPGRCSRRSPSHPTGRSRSGCWARSPCGTAMPPPTPAELRRCRVRELLAILVLERSVTRDRLVDLLWPDLDPSAGGRNLRVTLSRLRRLLEPDRAAAEACFCVRSDLERVWLHRAPALIVDLWQLRSRLARARAARGAGDLVAVGIRLGAAKGLSRGRALADLERIPDLGAAVAEVVALRLTVLLELGELRLRTGQPTTPAGWRPRRSRSTSSPSRPTGWPWRPPSLAATPSRRTSPPGARWRHAGSWAHLLRPRLACCSAGRCASYPPPGGPSALPEPGPPGGVDGPVRPLPGHPPAAGRGPGRIRGCREGGSPMSWRWPAMSLPE